MQATLITIDRPDYPFIGVDVKSATLTLPDGSSYAVDFTIVHEPNAPGRVMVHVPALHMEFEFKTGPISSRMLYKIVKHEPPQTILNTLHGLVLYITESKILTKV